MPSVIVSDETQNSFLARGDIQATNLFRVYRARIE